MANAMCLERKIVEERQSDYSKGNSLDKRIENFIYKCSLCK